MIRKEKMEKRKMAGWRAAVDEVESEGTALVPVFLLLGDRAQYWREGGGQRLSYGIVIV